WTIVEIRVLPIIIIAALAPHSAYETKSCLGAIFHCGDLTMRIPQVCSLAKSERTHFHSSKRLISLVLATQMFIPASVVSAATIGDAAATAGMWIRALNWLNGSASPSPADRGVKPRAPEQKSEKLNRLARLQINPKGTVQLQSRESMLFTAVPFDTD